MRILIIPSWYPTPASPVNGIFIREQADALHRVHEIRVLYLEMLPRGRHDRPRRQQSTERGYVEEWIEVPSHPFIWRFTYLWYLFRAVRSFRRQFPPDILHAHIALPAGWGALLLRWFLRAPVVLTENMSEFTPWLGRATWRWMARQAFLGADAVVAVSEGLGQRICKCFGPPKKLMVVPNIVDTSRFAPTPLPSTTNGYRLLFVGLMETPQKGIPVLLDALAELRRDPSLDIHLDLVGDGGLRAGYETQARKLGLAEIVTFHGLQPHSAIARLLGQCHALVLPSLHEAAPLVIIEALASGRPVISTRCGGPEFMLDSTNGRIVEPGQAAPLAAAIRDLLLHLDHYDPQQIAAAAASRYSYTAITSALTKLYRSLLSEVQPGLDSVRPSA
jgi:glycosyltransferase involved in cell wall biosynthesis